MIELFVSTTHSSSILVTTPFPQRGWNSDRIKTHSLKIAWWALSSRSNWCMEVFHLFVWDFSLVRWNEWKTIRILFFIDMVGNWSSSLNDSGSPISPTEGSNIVSVQYPTIVQAATLLRAAQIVKSSELWLEVNVGVVYTHFSTFCRIWHDIECTKLIR